MLRETVSFATWYRNPNKNEKEEDPWLLRN